MKILILGGTAEARQLANRLVALGHDVITSLAGRTQDPILPEGGIRMGPFGGIPGLCAYLRAAKVDRLVDATHPYAGLISINAVAAAKATGVRLIRYMRPEWEPQPGQSWTHVSSVQEAADALPAGANVLLTTGHTGLETFLERSDCRIHVRVIQTPELMSLKKIRSPCQRAPQVSGRLGRYPSGSPVHRLATSRPWAYRFPFSSPDTSSTRPPPP